MRTFTASTAVRLHPNRKASTTPKTASERITSPFPADPRGNRLPLGCRFRRELTTATVKVVTTGFLRKRMHQQSALLWMAGGDVSPDGVEILPRLFLIPHHSAW